MKQTIVITGACGFAGRAMRDYLRSVRPDLILIGVDVAAPPEGVYDFFCRGDVSDFDQIRGLMEQQRPNYILHFAGSFGTGDSIQIYRVNVLSAAALLEAVRLWVPKAVFIAVGSAAEYGHVKSSDLPVQEYLECHPVSPYGLSKYLATLTVQYYARVHGLSAMVVRPFQLLGKGVTDRLAPGAFAKRLKEAMASGKREISVGNLESSRDFLDIQDAVRAIWMLCENPAPGEIFNLCSGRPVKMKELLDLMIGTAGQVIRPVTDPTCVKSRNDVSQMYGSFHKIKKHCGWEPEKVLLQSIREMLV
jgi:GDP-4-dehydro-6-deoxy-D-mannose reductase